MKKIVVTTMAVSLAWFVFGQAEPGSKPVVTKEAPPPPEAPVLVQDRDANSMLEDFLATKKWSAGIVKDGKKTFLIQTGTAVISAPPESPSYNSSRQLAFDKAMLDAKAKMAKTLEQAISVAMTQSYKEGSQTAQPSPEQEMAQAMDSMPKTSVGALAVRVVTTKLSKALKDMGVDLAAEQAAGEERYQAALEKAKKLVASDSFQKTIQSAANCAISGMQAYYVVEVQKAGNQGEIGVVAMWSPALAEMAASLVTGQPVALKSPKRPIREQLTSDPKVLLSTFGVQQMIDEEGKLVLVSYAQSAARSESMQAKKIAYDKAALAAQAQIRSFAGEMVEMQEASNEAEQTLDFGGKIPDYSDNGSYEQFKKTATAKMTCNGIQTIKSWNAVHPVSGKPVYGVVCAWSPASAEMSRAMKSMIESTAKAGAEGNRSVPTANGTVAPSSSSAAGKVKMVKEHIGTGAAADDDAF